MDNPILFTESFSSGKSTYFFDVRLTCNRQKYITLACCHLQEDETYQRVALRFWQRDFGHLIQAFSSLFHHAAHLGIPDGLYEGPTAAKGIKSWQPEERPREKLVAQGQGNLSDAELLAMLIGSGTTDETAVALAGRILASVDFNLVRLSELSVLDLCAFRGIGFAKSSTIMASMELARRLAEQQTLLSGENP